MATKDSALDALRDARTIAVVGLDSRRNRPAFQIASYLQQSGYRIVPVHRGRFPADEVLGEHAYESLRDIPEDIHIDLVDVFVRSSETTPVVEDAVAVHADCVWLQSGITNDAALQRAHDAGLATTQDRCTMVEHRRFL
jgi:predicted CoA-binding protein